MWQYLIRILQTKEYKDALQQVIWDDAYSWFYFDLVKNVSKDKHFIPVKYR